MNTFDEIDFAGLYRRHLQHARRRRKSGRDWDQRAPILSRGIFEQPYVTQFVTRLDLTDCRTLLDVGCGPGTIGLSVAHRLEHVYELDYSPAMLEACAEAARARGLANVTTILKAWEDDWSEVPACDLVVASRSTLVADLDDAIGRMCAKARRRACLTSTVGGRFLDEGVLRALGRLDPPLPDYVYVIALLHQRGIHPRVDYIEGSDPVRSSPDFDEFWRRVEWSLGELTEADVAKLRDYYAERGGRVGQPSQRWAFIWWDTA